MVTFSISTNKLMREVISHKIEKYLFSFALEKNSIKKHNLAEFNGVSEEIKQTILQDSILLFKDAPAGVIDLKTSYVVPDDSKAVYTEKKVIKILNENGKRAFSDIQIGFDASFQSIEIEKIRVYTKGQVYEIPQSYVRIVSPWSGTYSNYKIATINPPNIGLNSTIEYDYKLITHHSLHPNDLQFSMDLQYKVPILNQKHELIYAKGKTLNIKYPDEFKPEIKRDDKNIYYTWQANNTKAIEIENNSKISDYLPMIEGAFFTSWNEIYNWLKPHYIGKNLDLSEKNKKFVQDLTKQAKTQSEKLQLAYNWINENIRYVAIEVGQGGVYPRNANEIFENKYGDCKDQATLLTSFLRELDIKAYPVLINTSAKIDMDTSLKSLEFSHAITYVEMGNEKFFCDVIAKQTPYNYLHPMDQNKMCFIIKDNDYKLMRTPVSLAKENLRFIDMKVNLLKNDNIIVQKSNQNYGESNTAYKNYFIGMNSNDIKENIQYDISYFCPGGILETYNIENLRTIDKPITINETFKVPNWINNISDNIYSFKIPSVYFSFDEVDQVERIHDLIYETTQGKKYNIEIQLPDNYIIYKLPENMDVQTDEVDFKYKYNESKNKLTLEIEYYRKGINIKAKEYKAYKTIHDDILNKVQEAIILQKI